jgi:hypothetical protein
LFQLEFEFQLKLVIYVSTIAKAMTKTKNVLKKQDQAINNSSSSTHDICLRFKKENVCEKKSSA